MKGADKIPNKVFESIPGGYFKEKEKKAKHENREWRKHRREDISRKTGRHESPHDSGEESDFVDSEDEEDYRRSRGEDSKGHRRARSHGHRDDRRHKDRGPPRHSDRRREEDRPRDYDQRHERGHHGHDGSRDRSRERQDDRRRRPRSLSQSYEYGRGSPAQEPILGRVNPANAYRPAPQEWAAATGASAAAMGPPPSQRAYNPADYAGQSASESHDYPIPPQYASSDQPDNPYAAYSSPPSSVSPRTVPGGQPGAPMSPGMQMVERPPSVDYTPPDYDPIFPNRNMPANGQQYSPQGQYSPHGYGYAAGAPPATYPPQAYARPTSSGRSSRYDDPRRARPQANRRQSRSESRGGRDRRDRFGDKNDKLYGALGALGGGVIGNELGHGAVSTAIGAALGGLGAHFFEKRE